MDGIRTGLDYKGVEAVMRLYRLPEDEHSDCFDRVRILEAVVLDITREEMEIRNRSDKAKAKGRK